MSLEESKGVGEWVQSLDQSTVQKQAKMAEETTDGAEEAILVIQRNKRDKMDGGSHRVYWQWSEATSHRIRRLRDDIAQRWILICRTRWAGREL
jgi:hypothetical protein